MGWSIDMEQNVSRLEVFKTLNCPMTLIFKVKFCKSCISEMTGSIDMERKGCESMGSRTHFVTLNFDLTRDLDLEF